MNLHPPFLRNPRPRIGGAGQGRDSEGRGLSMAVLVAVMKIRVVRMGVLQAGMNVFVRVRFARRIVRPVWVLVMLVVGVPVFMDDAAVGMGVIMPVGQVSIDADQHQRASHEQLRG